MTPAVLRVLPDEPHLERQMGCMAGFFQIFDRHQSFPVNKRIYGPKRLPTSTAVSSAPPSVTSEGSPSPTPSFAQEKAKPVAEPEEPARPSLPMPVLDFKEGMRSSWKFRESPRLSLDSRVDGKGGLRPREVRTTAAVPESAGEEDERQRRSPSVVARLMGLEALPGSVAAVANGDKAELRRSASESRVPRDVYRFISIVDPDFKERSVEVPKPKAEPARAPPAPPSHQQHHQQMRKSFFDAQDFFPEKIRTVEMERRMMEEEPGKEDLEALKQILEALQLTGLLHCKKSEPLIGQRNFVYDNHDRLPFSSLGSPIVVMKPTRLPPSPPSAADRRGRARTESPPPLPSNSRSRTAVTAASRRSPPSHSLPSVRTRRQQTPVSPPPTDGNGRSPSSPARRRQAEVQKRRSSSAATPTATPERRIPAVDSPRASPRKTTPEPARSPRNRIKSTARISPDEDEISTTLSDSSCFSASSHFDSERLRMLEYREGRRLLDRCDKLLHSIAEMTTSADHGKDPEQQPSPVSVLDDSPFLTSSTTPTPTEDGSGSPFTKRCIDFKDHLDDWNESMSPVRSVDPDLMYMMDIAKPSDQARIQRKLLSDAAAEILERQREVSPYEAFGRSRSAVERPAPEIGEVWAEVGRLAAAPPTDGDLCDVVCGALKKDLEGRGGDGRWSDRSVEMSEVVLGIERMVFKDLVAETIGGLAMHGRLRRKLVF
ncbi:hypothetical protein QJS10_CPB15g01896 [Acorus calamus]|uniref:DUF4378 domain-containing protein n=1 Tax=Acorus calamus TaxID=4465 RepID=A0AAV9D4F2_ACOCL|nr:hypothetical protein QJS10_CPB15g01896 [Acorus calamus]